MSRQEDAGFYNQIAGGVMGKRIIRRAGYKRFAGFPFDLLESENFRRLSAHGKALLLDLRTQFKGSQNGNIDATWSRLSRQECWRSKETLHKALNELIYYGFIVRTRKGKRIGGKHYPSLYALTWEPLNDLPKLGIAGTRLASHEWLETKSKWSPPARKRKKTRSTPAVLDADKPRTSSVLDRQKSVSKADKVVRISQVRRPKPQVRQSYSLNKLAIHRANYLSDVLRHFELGAYEIGAGCEGFSEVRILDRNDGAL